MTITLVKNSKQLELPALNEEEDQDFNPLLMEDEDALGTKLFQYSGKRVRIFVKNDTCWWVAKDVCDILELQVNNLSTILDSYEISNSYDLEIRIPGVNRGLTLITESGLYSLVFKSRKTEAKAFKFWVTNEVLPSIMRTGKYSTEGRDIEDLLLSAYRAIKEKRQQLERAHLDLKQRDQQLALQAPKVEAYEDLVNAAKSYKFNEVAKLLNEFSSVPLGQNRLINHLIDKKVLYRNNDDILPYQAYVDRGYFTLKTGTYSGKNKKVRYVTTHVTFRGVEWLKNIFSKEGIDGTKV